MHVKCKTTRRSQHSQECKDPRRHWFCDSWHWPLTFWPHNKWVSKTHRGTFCKLSLVILAALFFLWDITTSGQSILTKCHIVRADFSQGRCNVTPRAAAVALSCHCWEVNDLFLLRTPQQRLSVLFSGLDNPQNFPCPWGSQSHLIHPLAHKIQPPKQHLDRFSRFLANVNSRSRSLYAISRPSVVCLLSVVCLSVCLWRWCTLLRRLNFSAILFHHTIAQGLYFSGAKNRWWGDAPFPLKFAFKVTHPLSNSAISTNIGS